MRNSLLVAPMPTGVSVFAHVYNIIRHTLPAASTSQILGNCECFEPFQVRFSDFFMFLSVTSRSVQHIRATCHGRRCVLTINCRMSFLIISTEFAIVNPHLLRELVDRKMWSNDIKQSIIAANGSVQHLQLPDDIKAMYVPFLFTSTHLVFILPICTSDTRLPGKSSSVRLSIWLRTGEKK